MCRFTPPPHAILITSTFDLSNINESSVYIDYVLSLLTESDMIFQLARGLGKGLGIVPSCVGRLFTWSKVRLQP